MRPHASARRGDEAPFQLGGRGRVWGFSSQADPIDWFLANPVGVDVDGSGGVVVVFFLSRAGQASLLQGRLP